MGVMVARSHGKINIPARPSSYPAIPARNIRLPLFHSNKKNGGSPVLDDPPTAQFTNGHGSHVGGGAFAWTPMAAVPSAKAVSNAIFLSMMLPSFRETQ